jgi:predicted MFS family arabinose efflux permease
MAWYEMATVVGIGGGFVAGALLWDRLGYSSFAAVTAIYALSLVLFLGIREVSEPRPEAARRTLSPFSALRRPRVLRFAPAWLCVNTIVGVWATHAAFQLAGQQHPDQYLAGGFTGTTLGAAFAYFSVAFMLGVYLWGMVIGSHRKTNIMLVTLAGIYVICLALLTINHVGQVGGLAFAVCVLVFGVGVVLVSGFTPAALAFLAEISEEAVHQRGAVMGLYSVMLGLGQLLGGALGGPFADLAAVDGLILLTALLGTGALGTLLALRRNEAVEPETSGSTP